MEVTGRCSLIIQGENLCFADIEETIGIKPTNKINKGKFINHTLGKNNQDLIRFDELINEGDDAISVFSEFLQRLLISKEYIQRLSQTESVYLKLFIQSDSERNIYKFDKSTLKMLSELEIEFDFVQLSWDQE